MQESPSTIAPLLSPELLAAVCCPLTRQPLRLASPAELATFDLPTALIREDGQIAFPIRDGIPILLPEAALPRNG